MTTIVTDELLEPAGLVTTRTGDMFAEALASVLQVDSVAHESHFFDDLGADSMVMARFCARVRKEADLPSVSMRDIYQYPSIQNLVTAFAVAPSATTAAPTAPAPSTAAISESDIKARTAQRLGDLLATVLQVESVPPGSHFFDDLGADSMVMARFCARVRKEADLPKISMREVYQHPSIEGLVTALVVAPPAANPAPMSSTAAISDSDVKAQLAQRLGDILATVLQVDSVPPGSHFFDDLGADSMVMARFCARVRKEADLPTVSMRDVYKRPTIEQLVESLPATVTTSVQHPVEPTTVSGSPEAAASLAPTTSPDASAAGRARPTSRVSYVVCGGLQVLVFLIYSSINLAILVRGYEWVSTSDGWAEVYRRSLIVGMIVFFVPVLLPIILKWTLIGRWKPQQIPYWSLAYVRFWFVKTAIRVSPITWLFTGSPLYSLNLRALGARIGPGVVILTRSVPACPDLISIGADTVIRKDALLSGYRAHDGVIETGPVTIGARALVGEAGVLDIHTSMGDDAQLAHASSLHSGQHVPDGQWWHGSPAGPHGPDLRLAWDGRRRRLRRVLYTGGQLLLLVGIGLPMTFGVADTLLSTSQLGVLLDPQEMHVTAGMFYLWSAITSAGLFFGGLLLSLTIVFTVPRLLNRLVPADREWPLYGARYAAHRLIQSMTNIQAFGALFGDSSYVVPYLRALGYRLDPVVQTGSNFGMIVKHENPFLCTVGSGTMVADGISFVNSTYSSTSFRLSRATIGEHSFLGNHIVYPWNSRVGDDVLLATKVMVPVVGSRQEHTGLLGAPSLSIPRTVRRDADLGLTSRSQKRLQLSRKNAHNVATMGLYLLVRWIWLYVTLVTLGAAVDLYHVFGVFVAPALSLTMLLFSMTYWVCIDRLVARWQLLAPQGVSIYDLQFWRHERYWKIPSWVYRRMLAGTPFQGLFWRLVGVRVGKRLFDDGLAVAEKDYITIGDDCTFNAATHLQCHSQEDGAFKSDRIAVGSRCTLSVAAFVHYGTTVGNDVVLAPNSFLMKGEQVPDGERWSGNPAQATPDLDRPTDIALAEGLTR